MVPRGLTPTDFRDPLTFHLVPPAGHLCSELSQHLFDGLAQNVLHIFMISPG